MTFKDQYTKPVEDLKLIVQYLLPYRREEELINLCSSGREIGTFDRTVKIRSE